MKQMGFAALGAAALLAGGAPGFLRAQTNPPPEVSIVWPAPGQVFGVLLPIKVKAAVTDPGGLIARVQFFSGTNLIGEVTNPPYNVIWAVEPTTANESRTWGTWQLEAVAIDSLGVRAESVPVVGWWSPTMPNFPIVQIDAPEPGTVFAAPASFAFSAELLANPWDTDGPLEFFVGTNSLGLAGDGGPMSATAPVYSVPVTNVPPGDFTLSVGLHNGAGWVGPGFWTITIHVVRLAIRSPRWTADGRFQFDVITSFPGKPNVTETSTNLLDWLPLGTNQPSSSPFVFTDPAPPTNSARFYRVVAPSE